EFSAPADRRPPLPRPSPRPSPPGRGRNVRRCLRIRNVSIAPPLRTGFPLPEGEGQGGLLANTWVTDWAQTWVTLSAVCNGISHLEKELLHPSTQAPKGPIDGVCGEACSSSATSANTRFEPSGCGESVTHVCAQSVTHVLATCREGERGPERQ